MHTAVRMPLVVEKFGGTSVGTVDRINHVADHLMCRHKNGESLVVVVSAMSGETNRLVNLASQISCEPTPRERDVLLSTGEQVTMALLSIALHSRGVIARSYTGSQVSIRTDSEYSKARILDIDVDRINADLDKNIIVVVAGFQGVDHNGNITTLGRGGSDTTAVAIAATLKADECRIYTDVDGVFTTDPKLVANARCLNYITYDEMLAMSNSGAKVLHARSVEIASKFNVPLRVLSSFSSLPGTYITHHKSDSGMMTPLISGIAIQHNEVKLSVLNISDTIDAVPKLLQTISDVGIVVDTIVIKVCFNGNVNLSFTVPLDDYKLCLKILHSNTKALADARIESDDGIVKISIIGTSISSRTTRVLETLADNLIEIKMISTSEIKITVVINQCDLDLAVNVLHDTFDLSERQPPFTLENEVQQAYV